MSRAGKPLDKTLNRLRSLDIPELAQHKGIYNDGGSLFLEVRGGGRGPRWCFYTTEDGRSHHRYFGLLSDVTLEEARQKRADFLAVRGPVGKSTRGVLHEARQAGTGVNPATYAWRVRHGVPKDEAIIPPKQSRASRARALGVDPGRVANRMWRYEMTFEEACVPPVKDERKLRAAEAIQKKYPNPTLARAAGVKPCTYIFRLHQGMTPEQAGSFPAEPPLFAAQCHIAGKSMKLVRARMHPRADGRKTLTLEGALDAPVKGWMAKAARAAGLLTRTYIDRERAGWPEEFWFLPLGYRRDGTPGTGPARYGTSQTFAAACHAAGKTEGCVRSRMRKGKMTFEEAIEKPVGGDKPGSLRSRAKAEGVTYSAVVYRIGAGWPEEFWFLPNGYCRDGTSGKPSRLTSNSLSVKLKDRGISPSGYRHRLERGWSPKRALSTPTR